ncbi:ABC transporter ATP-binding protein [Periweissella cryptocerci]|uniref:ABC transporter ATP-binding protein n=1 Tax=Periweissella cryptocerci TaxID=2506420 RepID=A0A4P6YST6_9LACO|nr:ABC transporter ATP-binding protein [Periweissella cryptocerci]QBO35693.1 ABC transporter ATP-binding protein [Periweissella cryptocerci]
MTDEIVLDVEHLQKDFGKFQALKDVTLQVKRGEVFGFIGPNGAGKSTTLRVILGILRKSGGQATLFGEDVYDQAVTVHKRIAYVPGDVYLWPNLTGGEVIDLMLKMSGEKHNARTDELIAKFQLDTRKKARTYSKGNRQKVALIAALSTDAEFFIFDEPTSGLDPLNEKIFQNEVLHLKEQGKSVLLSSHILSEVEKMVDRLAIIREGTVVETGSLAELRHLTRTSVSVTTKQAMTGLEQLAGVHDLVATVDNGVTKSEFMLDGEKLADLMAQLSTLAVLDLKVQPATLEDVFMRYYNDANDARAEG